MDQTLEDGWTVDNARAERFYRLLRDHPVPRPFGIVDQIKIELTSIAAVMWLLVAILIAWAVIDGEWYYFLAPGLAIAFFGREMFRLTRLWRTGQAVIVRVDGIIRAAAHGSFYVSGQARIGDELRPIELCAIAS